jgi:hypothetical protein
MMENFLPRPATPTAPFRSLHWSWLVGVLCLAALPGCSRMFWRSQADFDTYNLLMQKTQDERWDLPRITVEADPRSRFYDPFNLDCEPLPPDDPAANSYMHWVDGMRGYKNWHKFGESMSVENPQWLANFGFEPEMAQASWERSPREEKSGVLERAERNVPTIRDLTLEQAIELSNIHNREYQTQMENVYLSALILTFDQFRFNVRYLGLNGAEPTSNLNYLNTPGVRDDLAFNNRFGVSQLLPTGGQWAMELANNTLWMFSGGNQTNSASVLSYSLVQPLMLGAGRKIVLEGLTQSEREVLYDVRSLARFRKVFFGDVVVNGQSGGQGVGYLSLLRQLQAIRNQQGNIDALIKQVERLRETNNELPMREELKVLPENIELPRHLAQRLEYDTLQGELKWTGQMSEGQRDELLTLNNEAGWRRAIENLFSKIQAGVVTLDLAQLLTNLGQQQTQLRNNENTYLNSADQFKLQLGLPTDFQLTLETSLLKQFELIDPQVNRLESALIDFKAALSEIDQYDPPLEHLRLAGEGIALLRDKVEREGLDLLKTDFVRVQAILPRRMEELTDPRDQAITQQDYERSRIVFQSVVLDEFRKITDTVDLLRERLQPGTAFRAEVADEPEVLAQLRQDLQGDALSAEQRILLATQLDSTRERLLQITLSLKAVQAGLRSELISLTAFELTQEEAVQLALENRLDLMNERGNVMDFRRQLEVAANQLEAVLNVVARGDVGTAPGNRPLEFRGDRSTFQLGVQFTAPLDQVQARNNYRSAQVDYQRARRDYMALEDAVKLGVRTEWRNLQTLRRNFETQRQNLRISAIQLDNAIETFNAPVRAGAGGAQPGGGGGGGNQNLGLNLINALNSVLTAQNQLIQIWVQYEQNRINIHRDMDIMQVDERGLWVDPVYQNLNPAGPDALPPNEPTHDDTLPAPTANIVPFDDLGLALRASSAVSLAAATDDVVAPRGGLRDDVGLSGVVVAGGATAGRPDGTLAARVAQHRIEARRADHRNGQTRPVPDHGDGAWHARQHEERGADQ